MTVDILGRLAAIPLEVAPPVGEAKQLLRDLAAASPPLWAAHPLGFGLWDCGSRDGVSVRLHFWDAATFSAVAHAPYHDHVWVLDSVVLVGALENVTFQPLADPVGDYVEGIIDQRGGTDSVEYGTERWLLNESYRQQLHSGDHYRVAPGVVHCTNPLTTSITLVRSQVVKSGGPRTFAKAGVINHAPTRRRIDPNESRLLTGRVFALFDQSSESYE